jgi:hypothetical protein
MLLRRSVLASSFSILAKTERRVVRGREIKPKLTIVRPMISSSRMNGGFGAAGRLASNDPNSGFQQALLAVPEVRKSHRHPSLPGPARRPQLLPLLKRVAKAYSWDQLDSVYDNYASNLPRPPGLVHCVAIARWQRQRGPKFAYALRAQAI